MSANTCLVCHPQERGTLLSYLPRRSSPTIALRHSTAVKIFPPCLFPLVLGGGCFILRVELSVEHRIQLLLQALSYIFIEIIFAVQMVKAHRVSVRTSFVSFPFRNDSDDCDGYISGIIFTVATVATVALCLFCGFLDGVCQRNFTPGVLRLILIADTVFLVQPAVFYVQILGQSVCRHSCIDRIGKLGR